MEENNNKNQNNNQNEPNRMAPRPRRRRGSDFLFYILVFALLVGFYMLYKELTVPKTTVLTYTELVQYAENGSLTDSITVKPVGGENYDMFTISGSYKKDTETYKFKLVVTEEL